MSRQQPHDEIAEMSVLGGILLKDGGIDLVADTLRMDDFFLEKHRVIYDAMLNLSARGQAIDVVTLEAELRRHSDMERVGGAAYLVTLLDACPVASNLTHYCAILSERAMNRRMIAVAAELAAAGYAQEADGCEILDRAISKLIAPHKREPRLVKGVVLDSVRLLKARHEKRGAIQGIPYGVDKLDIATNGMHRGELIVVAGRPSMGKSAFMGNIAENAATAGYHVMLFSLEMSATNIVDRMIASRGRIPYAAIRSGQLQDSDWPRNTRACEEINGWPLLIDDTPGVTLREIRSKAKRQKARGLDMIAIDYLQLMGVSKSENRVQAIGEISRGLKQLARELDVIVVLLSQLNRGVDSRTDKKPVMSDLRDSGEIEQDADVILFPFRPAAYCSKCKSRVDDASHDYRVHQAKAEIIIGKQRNGESNISIPVAWLGNFQRFEAIK